MTPDQEIAVGITHACYIFGVQNCFYQMAFYLLRVPQATINLNFSLYLSHLFSFFLTLCPYLFAMECFTATHTEIYLLVAVTDIFQLARQKSPVQTSIYIAFLQKQMLLS